MKLIFIKKMIFHNNVVAVFLLILIQLHISYCTQPHGVNETLFLLDHPLNCKRSEVYSFDNFSCFPCDFKHHLEPSYDKLSCFCAKGYKTVSLYDSHLKRPVCSRICKNKKVDGCTNITTQCEYYYINKTSDQSESFHHIRILTYPTEIFKGCSCDKKSNYVYNNYCIWKDLLKHFLSYNAYWQKGKIFADLKFISFFCQQLNNMTSCNHLANLCVQSFFDTDKNSPCRVFFLSQASDAGIYSNFGEDLHRIRPLLFYKRGKDTIQELEKKIQYSYNSSKTSMDLTTVVYSLQGQIIRWGPFKMNHINLCEYRNNVAYRNIAFFKSFHFKCELSMDTIVDLADLFANKQFFSVFLNYSLGDKRYLRTIPILIDNAFDGNMESNVAEWQMVKRFQLISTNPSTSILSSQIPKYDDKFKLHRYKNINILRKFEFYCSVTNDNTIKLPYIVLSYHKLDISSNTSLNDLYKFKFSVRFEKEQTFYTVYKICLPLFLTISFGMALFRGYTLKCRRYLDCCDITIITQILLYLMSYIGNSFVIAVIMDAICSVIAVIGRPQMILISRNENLQIPKIITYIAIFLKGLHFVIFFWNTARVDIFFIDWERPKNCETSFHVKNNLETSSQCSSIRGNAENNVSAWRIFFVANEWIKLCNVHVASTFLQGLSSLTLYWFITGGYPDINSGTMNRLLICITIYFVVHIIQRIFRYTVLNQIIGIPSKKFVDICTMTNVSVLMLVDSSYGYYVHGRSPHGSADINIQSIVLQLHREAQNMCAKRGLLDDSNFQTYIILPPYKLSEQIQKLTHLKTNSEKVSHVYFQSESNFGNHFEGTLEGSTIAYNRKNRFLCAFIDHAIKDMDYIIKEKSLIEKMLSCEFNSFLTENQGTFYIDNSLTFGTLFPYGNQNYIFLMELVLLMTMDLLTNSFVASILIVCVHAKIVFRIWVRNNIANKTLIDKRFLM